MRASTARLEIGSPIADYLELTKPRITTMVVVTTLVGLLLSVPSGSPEPLLRVALAAILGTALLASSSSALNMWWERELDRKMERTSTRPIAAGRMVPQRALGFGVAIGTLGLVVLGALVNLLTAALGLATVALYLLVYTPLKRRTHWSTVVGAVPGAIPPMMGWTAFHNDLSAPAWSLFAILFFWQMPHFYAIAWLYREQYQNAGFRMLTATDRDGARTGRFMVAFTLGLLVVSLYPFFLELVGPVYLAAAAVLGLYFLFQSLRFWTRRDRLAARAVMLYSVLYLPLVLAVLLADSWAL